MDTTTLSNLVREYQKRGSQRVADQIIIQAEPIFQSGLAAHLKAPIYGYDKEDLLQEVRLQVYQNLDKFDPEKAAFQTWCYTLIKNRLAQLAGSARSAHKYTSGIVSIEELDVELADISGNPESLILETAHKKQLWDCLQRAAGLREKDIEIVEAYKSGKSMRELAKELGISPTSMAYHEKRLMERARALLKKELE